MWQIKNPDAMYTTCTSEWWWWRHREYCVVEMQKLFFYYWWEAIFRLLLPSWLNVNSRVFTPLVNQHLSSCVSYRRKVPSDTHTHTRKCPNVKLNSDLISYKAGVSRGAVLCVIEKDVWGKPQMQNTQVEWIISSTCWFKSLWTKSFECKLRPLNICVLRYFSYA